MIKNFAATVLAMLGLAVAIACMGPARVNASWTCTTTDTTSPTLAQASQMVEYIQQLGVNGQQCCTAGVPKCVNQEWICADMYPQQSNTDLTRGQICALCDSCTSCSVAGDALNDVLANCVVSINNVAYASGFEDSPDLSQGFTFVLGVYT
ncbi:unnamed protein product [Calypogeia fissa]